jgi:transposase
MSKLYIGLDVHSKMTQYAVQSEDGSMVAQGQIPTTPEGFRQLRERCGVEPGTRVGMETGTMASYVARELQQQGLTPVVVSAYEVRAKAYRPLQKSDRRDAFEICDGLRRDQYRAIVHVPPMPIQRLRETLARRRHFVRIQSAEVAAAKHLLRASGRRHLSWQMRFESGWQKLLERVDDARLVSEIEFHHRVWRAAGEQVEALDASLVEQSKGFQADFELLQTVPGVGPVVALTVIASLSDARRFPSAKHVASYAGLVPSTDQSSDRDWHGHITKQGSMELRAMLCEAAHHACRKEHPLNPYLSSLCARRGYKMAVVSVAHRLCRILYAMLRDQAPFEITKLGIEVGPFEKKIVRPYRLKSRM